MSDIVELKQVDNDLVHPDTVLEGAKGCMKETLVIGWTGDDSLFMASSRSYNPDLLVLLEIAKAEILNGYYTGEE